MAAALAVVKAVAVVGLLALAFWVGQTTGRGLLPAEAESSAYISLAVATLAAVVATLNLFVGSWLRTREARIQQSVTKRFDVYDRSLVALGILEDILEELVAEEQRRMDLSDEYREGLLKLYEKTRATLRDVTASAEYLVPGDIWASMRRAASNPSFQDPELELQSVRDIRDAISKHASSEL